MEQDNGFEIGLIAAGAVSAGAYTAGVLDFLFEAMDAWERAGAHGVEVPHHRVSVAAMVGASAGAVNAALAATAAQRRFLPVDATNIGTDWIRAQNPFARAWIDGPDILRLLDTDDVRDDPVRALLNGRFLEEEIARALAPGEMLDAPRPWLKDLRVRMTVGNLTGTPYALPWPAAAAMYPAGMLDHAEVVDFTLAGAHRHFLPLPGQPAKGVPQWEALGLAALASAAFPLALPARRLVRSLDHRAPRAAFIAAGTPEAPHAGAWSMLEPAWSPAPDPWAQLCVDGGIANNEPVDLCRDALLGAPGQRLPREGDRARGMMIMVDPFPEPPQAGPSEGGQPLPRLAGAVVSAMRNQARFRPEDIALALREDVYSRQLIAPTRSDPATRRSVTGSRALAGGALGGFLGFFDRRFRVHDFLLGRRNMQRFLQRHLTLPVANPVVAGWALDADGTPTPLARHVMALHGLDPAEGEVPLVPLLGRAAIVQPQPDWPGHRFSPDRLRRPIARRVAAVTRSLAAERGGIAAPLGCVAAGPLACWASAGAVEALWKLAPGKPPEAA